MLSDALACSGFCTVDLRLRRTYASADTKGYVPGSIFHANVVGCLVLGSIPEVIILKGAAECNKAEPKPETCDHYIKAGADFSVSAKALIATHAKNNNLVSFFKSRATVPP